MDKIGVHWAILNHDSSIHREKCASFGQISTIKIKINIELYFFWPGQDRVGMNKNTGKWFDVFEERRFQFVCQERVWQCASKVCCNLFLCLLNQGWEKLN